MANTEETMAVIMHGLDAGCHCRSGLLECCPCGHELGARVQPAGWTGSGQIFIYNGGPNFNRKQFVHSGLLVWALTFGREFESAPCNKILILSLGTDRWDQAAPSHVGKRKFYMIARNFAIRSFKFISKVFCCKY
jgi:hypothetical protein